MDQLRQKAYRYLLYQAMLDIRPIAWQRARWNPFRWRLHTRQVAFAGALADALHNLALFAACNFERFDESHFWRDLDRLAQHWPDRRVNRYHEMFESALQGDCGPRFG